MHPITRRIAPLLVAALASWGCGEDKGSEVTSAEPARTPPTAIDPIARELLTKSGRRAAASPESPAVWIDHGDNCLANLWPEEAVLAYRTALRPELGLPADLAGQVRWRLAAALQSTQAIEQAEAEAVAALEEMESTEPYPAGWLTVAARRLDEGRLDEADAALGRATGVEPVLRALVSIQLDVQQGRIDAARATVDDLLGQGLSSPVLSRLAVLVGRAQGDLALVEAHEATAIQSLEIPPDPLLRGVQSRAVHELADLQRCLVWSRSLPPQQALQRIGPVLRRRPESSTVRMMVAELLRKLGRFEEAKAVLDVIHDRNPADHEYWSVDAIVHLELANAGRPELRERARASSARALEINPSLAYGWQIAAVIHKADERWGDAADAYRRAAELADDPALADSFSASAAECDVKSLAP